MARDPEDQETLNTTDGRTTGNADNGKDALLNRRSYLKLTGTTAAAAAAATGVTAASADYDVIEVGAGQTFTKRLSRGETWENVLIDITARGAGYRIIATTDDWTIRNIGVRGKLDSSPGSQNFVVQVSSSGASGLIENVYLPGTTYPRRRSSFPSGIFVHANHAGDLEIRNVYATDLPSHAIYASAPGNRQTGGKGGTVRIHDSYAADLENSGFRIGTDGSYVDNCVAFRTVRGLWSRWANTEARGCDFGDNATDIVVGQSGYRRSSTVTLDGNTCFGTAHEANGRLNGRSSGTPEERIPEGCPQSATEAASGGSSTDPGDGEDEEPALDNLLLVDGGGTSGVTNYEFAVSGEVEKSTEQDATVDDEDTIDGGTVTGAVGGWCDAFRFSGDLTDLTVDGDAKVYVNDELVDPSDFDGDDDEEPALDNLLLVDGGGTSGVTNYEFAVSGAVEKSSAKDATIDDEDTIDGGSVTGAVGGWRDAFQFSGDLTDLTVEGDAQIYVNDEPVDPDDVGEEPALDNLLLVDGGGTSSVTNYEFAVSGAVEKSSAKDATIDDEDTIDGGSVTGAVGGWRDAFQFSGDLTDLTVDGDAKVYVNDEPVDPSDFDGDDGDDSDDSDEEPALDNLLLVDGGGTSGVTNYEFAVSGAVEKSSAKDATIDDEDAIDGGTVTGAVGGWRDAFQFGGDLTDLTVEGDAKVYVNDEPVDPDSV
ncbi:hypothetical protein [Halosolutus gelatinilyticus]|uniref:hypothetical protein n=1 Tax=Halosolutus gelatinilyticus TaxID=2931975 RepID=UPI001FF49D9B|nr:hypothetical protein [Halosolutus gelatinilyticus]